MSEARQFHRFDVRLAAEVRHERGTFTAVTKNVSVDGVALSSERLLRDGEQLRLSLFLVLEGIEDERTPPLVVGGRVIWVEARGERSCDAGIRFEGISAAQVQWLEQFLARQANVATG